MCCVTQKSAENVSCETLRRIFSLFSCFTWNIERENISEVQNFVTQRRKKTQNQPKIPLFALLETASRVDARHEIILPVHKPVRAKFKEIFFTISRLCALILFFIRFRNKSSDLLTFRTVKIGFLGSKKRSYVVWERFLSLIFLFSRVKNGVFFWSNCIFHDFSFFGQPICRKTFQKQEFHDQILRIVDKVSSPSGNLSAKYRKGVPYEVIRKKDRAFQGKRHFMSISCPHNPKLFICISMGFIHRLIQIIRYPPEKEFLRPVIASWKHCTFNQ